MTNALSAYFRRLRAEMGFGEKIFEVTRRQEAASSGEQLQASKLSSSSREARNRSMHLRASTVIASPFPS